MAAELLCRNAKGLDICNSLHWPSAVNSAWIPDLPVTAKLLITDALIHMALASNSKNALRELAIRLYGISDGDPSPRVKGVHWKSPLRDSSRRQGSWIRGLHDRNWTWIHKH